MTNWGEIENLSNYFKKLQEDSCSEKLSEANCIELLNKILQHKTCTFTFTTDGKEVVTPKNTIKEIKNELAISGGRMNLIDLALSLKLNLNHTQNLVNDLIVQDNNLMLIVGQLISKQFEQNIAIELNQKLLLNGIIYLNDITKSYDLPGEYIQNVIKTNVQRSIHGLYDEENKTLYTEKYVNDQKAIVKGILNALTMPIPLEFLLQNYELNSNLLLSIIEKLITTRDVQGMLFGNKKDKFSLIKFIPSIYIYLQKKWVLSQYIHNKYIDFHSMAKLSINDPKSFFNKLLKEKEITEDQFPIVLHETCISKSIIDSLLTEIEHVLSTSNYCDLLEWMPNYLTENDMSMILDLFKNKYSRAYEFIDDHTLLWMSRTSKLPGTVTTDSGGGGGNRIVIILPESDFLVTKSFVETFMMLFSDDIVERAKQNYKKNKPPQLLFDEDHLDDATFSKANKPLLSHDNDDDDQVSISKKEERKRRSNISTNAAKKESGLGGGGGGGGGGLGSGSRGREHKTKSTTKKQQYGKSSGSSNKNHDETRDRLYQSGFTREEISELVLTRFVQTIVNDKRHRDASDATELDDKHRYEILADQIAEILIEKFDIMYVNEYRKLCTTAANASRQETRQEVEKYQDRLNEIFQKISVFYKGNLVFSNEKLREELNRYLLKTFGLELFAILVTYCKIYLSREVKHPPDSSFADTIASHIYSTTDARKKAINECPESCKQSLIGLSKILAQNDVSAFLNEIEQISQTNALNFMLKKFTKKQERPIVLAYRQELMGKLDAIRLTDDIARGEGGDNLAVVQGTLPLAFHLLVLVAFVNATKNAIHASGKFVPELVEYLTNMSNLGGDVKQLIADCQKIIIEKFSNLLPENKALDDEKLDGHHCINGGNDDTTLSHAIIKLKDLLLTGITTDNKNS